MSKLKIMWLRLTEWWTSPRKAIEVYGELPPGKLPSRDLLLLREGGEAWSVLMRCPCGCGQPVELPLIREARPRWSLRVDKEGPYPSAFRLAAGGVPRALLREGRQGRLGLTWVCSI
jgi:hypothetical protein